MENIAGAQIGSGLQLVGGVLSTTGGGGSGSTYNPIISDTYSNIETLVTNNQLVVGQHYLITDYQTKHIIPYTSAVNTGSIEPLIVLAVSTNKFNNLAYSTIYPEDIIHYDFNDNSCEDNTTPRTGKIIYRKDKFNNSTFYDFINVKFRRWSIDCDVIWSSGSVYNKNDLIKYNNIIYQVSNTTTINDTIAPNNDALHYVKFLDLLSTSYWSWSSNINDFNVGNNPNKTNLTIGSYIDCYTFDDGTGNISISGKHDNEIKSYNSLNNLYNNIVMFGYNSKHSNVIGNNSINNTIINDFYNNILDNNFSGNIINNFYNNTIGNYFDSNTIGNYFDSNTIGNYFNSNTIGNYFNSNIIDNDSYYNTIGEYFRYNIIGNGFQNNIIGSSFNNNTIGNSLAYNIIGNSFDINTIGNFFQSNLIENFAEYNTIGNYCSNFTISAFFKTNTIQDSIYNINFTSATHVYNNTYNKTIFRGSDSSIYLSYFDRMTMIYVPATS